MAAPTIVGTPTTATFTAAASVDVTPDAGTIVGDWLLVILSAADAMVVTPPSGFTANEPSGGLDARAGVYYRKLASVTFPVTFSFGANETGQAVAVTVRGQDPTTAIDAIGAWGSAPSTNASVAASVTTTVNATMLLACFGRMNSSTAGDETYTEPPGMTERGDVNGGASVNPTASVNAMLADAVQATAGASGTKTATRSASNVTNANSVLIALNPAVAGVAPTWAQAKTAAAKVEDTGLAAATATVTLDNTPSNGDVMIAVVASVSTATRTLTPAAGWTLIATGSSSTTNLFTVYRKVAGVAESPVSAWTSTTSSAAGTADAGIAVVVSVYSGVDNVTPENIVGTATNAAATSTNSEAPSVTSVIADDLLIGVWTVTTSSTYAEPAGMAEIADTGGANNIFVTTQTLAAPGAAGIKTATLSGALSVTTRRNILIAVAPAPVASGGSRLMMMGIG